jgi:hypothetical protein
LRRQGENAPKMAIGAQSWSQFPKSHPPHYAPLESGVNEA